ncbi:MAG: DUF885 family protein [Thermomicrobiales bacterium]
MDRPPAAPMSAAGMDASPWLDAFFKLQFERLPVNATFTGIHDHDGQLPDWSDRAVRQWSTEIDQLLARAPSGAGEPEAVRHDLLLAANHLQLQRHEFDLPQFHTGNPAHWTGEAVFSIIGLFLRDAEPGTERARSALSRMRLIPEFLAQSRAAIREAPAEWTARASRESRAAAAYFDTGLPLLLRQRDLEIPGILDAAISTRDAFLDHARWLDEELAARPRHDVAAGRDAFDRYLRLGHCLPAGHDAHWLERHAARALTAAQERLAALAEELFPGSEWREQLERLPDHHRSVDDYDQAYPAVWEAARAAATAAKLVTWPDYPIEYVPIPESDREAAADLYYLFYRCPPPFGRPETHRYLVTPIDRTMPAGEQERRLRQVNDSQIKLNHVVHHGGLGHHVQNWHAFRAPSRVGQVAGVDCANRIGMFCAGTLVEGWACYATQLMEEIGFLTPLERLGEAHGAVRMAARAVADVGIHTGAMSLAEAAAMYEREAAMPAGAAMGEAVKNSMFPGAAVIYLLGVEGIRELRESMTGRDGAGSDVRAFHDRFLGYGAIPVALIAESMRAGETSDERPAAQ